MPDESHKKFDRVIAILIQLQSKRIVKAQELADRFQVSLRTIYRDIKTLENSGVPIASEAGVGYSIVEGYRLPPVMFTQEEAASFIAAEKLMQRFTDETLGANFQSAMYKVKSVMRWNDKDRLDILDAQILVQKNKELFNKSIPNALEVLMNGIVSRKKVYLKYQSMEAEMPVARDIEPIGLYHENDFWYLLAYCHLRKDYRKFRTDRMYAIKALNDDFELQHEPLSYYLKEREDDRTPQKIIISLEKSHAKWLQHSKNIFGFQSQIVQDGKVEMTFLYADNEEYFVRWFLMMGDVAQIIEPENLREKMKNLLDKITYNLKK